MLSTKKIIENLINKMTLKYTEYLSGKPKGRVALFYIAHPLLPPKALRNRSRFSNDGIAQNIPRVLNELGYVVDIIHFQNNKWKPRMKYDFVISHGGTVPSTLYPILPKHTKKLYFATGRYWEKANIAAAQRMFNFTMKTGFMLSPERNVADNEEYAIKNSDGIICLGNKNLEDEYREFNGNVKSINNGVFPLANSQRPKVEKSKDIIFLAGRGNIHKGLDLLIDVFSSQTEFTLHVCQHIDEEFSRIMAPAIKNCKNIIIHNFVKMRSPKFMSIAETCSYAILPTCSEGQPGSILECMLYGLVPIIPKEANIDFDSFAINIQSLDSHGVKMCLDEISNLSDEDYANRSARAIECCKEDYSEQAFKNNFRDAIQSVLRNIKN